MASIGHLLYIRDKKKKISEDLRRRVKASPCLVEKTVPPLPMVEKTVPPLPVVEKTVYIRGGSGSLREKTDWYVLKLSSNDPCSSCGGWKRKREGNWEANEFIPIELISKEADTPWSGCCVALDSTIYCIGGNLYSKSWREVIAKEDSDPVDGQWRKVSQTKGKRAFAHALTADDKIYVFGGDATEEDTEGPEVEVFDPIRKTCESVQPIPVTIDYLCDFFATYDSSSKKIICGAASPGVLLAYDVTGGDSCPWQILERTGYEFPWGKAAGPVLLDNTLYWICSDGNGGLKITLYDMNLKKWDNTAVLGFDHVFYQEKPYNMSFLHFRGNEFYLFWLDQIGIGDELKKSLLLCTRILVSKLVDKQRGRIHLKARCLSTKTYLFPKQVYRMDAVVLGGDPQ